MRVSVTVPGEVGAPRRRLCIGDEVRVTTGKAVRDARKWAPRERVRVHVRYAGTPGDGVCASGARRATRSGPGNEPTQPNSPCGAPSGMAAGHMCCDCAPKIKVHVRIGDATDPRWAGQRMRPLRHRLTRLASASCVLVVVTFCTPLGAHRPLTPQPQKPHPSGSPTTPCYRLCRLRGAIRDL